MSECSRVKAWSRVATLAVMTAVARPGSAIGQELRAGPPKVGPVHGSLVIVGGNLQSPEIYERFIELAGGPDAKIVIIPTAGGAPSYDKHDPALMPWRENGAENLVLLHTYDRKEADTDAFVAPLADADGVFFLGGRQWRLVDAYAGTKTETAIREVLDRGGVIGGSSAGASICGSFLVRGDTKGNEVMMGDHQVGFGYLRNVGIDQHVLRRNRQFDLVKVVEAHPELLGIGIDENTAIVVEGDQFEVMGASYALIYDDQSTVGDGGRFYFLAPGDRFNLATREATRAAPTRRAVENVTRKPWSGGR
jgi:cyanophycinase